MRITQCRLRHTPHVSSIDAWRVRDRSKRRRSDKRGWIVLREILQGPIGQHHADGKGAGHGTVPHAGVWIVQGVLHGIHKLLPLALDHGLMSKTIPLLIGMNPTSRALVQAQMLVANLLRLTQQVQIDLLRSRGLRIRCELGITRGRRRL